MDDAEFNDLVDKYEHTNYTLTLGGGAVKGVDLTFSIVNGMSLYRVRTLASKEPETLAWALSLTPSDILFDVGANIGLFTVVAAKVSGATVYAFEPESQNYALLHRNIFLNGIHERVWAFCAAVTDKLTMDKLFLSGFSVANSCHQFAKQVTFNLESVSGMLGQGCIGISLDEAIAAGMLPVPTHIKVDVDGFEHKVLAGASTLLRNRKLRSIIMEINARLPEHLGMFRVMEENGFTYSKTQMTDSNCGHRVGDPRFDEFYNVIFTRSGDA